MRAFEDLCRRGLCQPSSVADHALEIRLGFVGRVYVAMDLEFCRSTVPRAAAVLAIAATIGPMSIDVRRDERYPGLQWHWLRLLMW